MIKLMLKPFLKRFIGPFISMMVVSMLSIALLSAFASTISNLNSAYRSYLKEYESVDALIKTDFISRSDIENFATEINDVDKIDARLTLDAYLKKSDGRIITSRIFTFNESENQIFKRYIVSSIDKSTEKVNVSVVRKFAQNNNFNLGDTIQIGFLNIYLDFYINEIVESPEAIQARANNYVWSDNTDFGYVYINETELDKALYNFAVVIEDKIKSDPASLTTYQKLINDMGMDLPNLINKELVGHNYASRFANQLLVEGKEGVNETDVLNTMKDYLATKEIKIKEASESHSLFYIIYIENAIKQLTVAAIFLPIFFYSVTMIVIGLFINQIIKSMTPEIGIMMSIGVGKKDIISIFLIYSLLMAIIAGIIGVALGFTLNYYLIDVLIRVYSMPTIGKTLNPLITIGAIISLALFSLLATWIACQRIFKITPKDATINNEAKRKKMPKRLEHFIEKAPMNIKLGVNSIVQNKRRFFVSTFSIFAAFIIIILALFFFVSKNELMNQTVERRLNFDCQVYLTEKATDDNIKAIKDSGYVKAFENCGYTYVKAKSANSDKEVYLECLGLEDINTTLVNIPANNGIDSTKAKESGLILNQADADQLKVKVGDKITINNIEVEVTDISLQYFHPITYLSKTQLDNLKVDYVSSFLINVSNEVEFLKFLDTADIRGLTVFTSSLNKDIHGIFDSIDVFIFVMVGFSFMMGFVILSIMSQNTLMEQKRQLSIFRAIGFRIIDISNLWTLQSVSHLIISSIFAIPIGYLMSVILFKMCSSAAQNYPIVFSVPAVFIALGFILLIIVLSHLFAMITIRRWNIAENTKSRE